MVRFGNSAPRRSDAGKARFIVVYAMLVLCSGAAYAQSDAPAPPVNLRAWNTGDFVQLYWYAPDTSSLRYNVYRAATGVAPALTAERLARPGFTDMALSPDPVTYTVTSVDESGRESTPVSVLVEPVAPPAGRAALSVYSKDDLIDDARLEDDSTMTAAKIQTFLVEHGSVLKDFSTGGRTAAQHIYDACREFRINPYVVLTTLQKEQGLIKSSGTPDPDHLAMGWATGDQSTYDFANQIYYGTKQFRRYADTLANVNQTHYHDVDGIFWQVGQTHHVYDGHVTPANRATAGLYIYTPYIGGSTGIGGNYLFWYTWYLSFAFDPGIPPGIPQPMAPGLESDPGPVISSKNPLFEWTRVDGAEAYGLYIRDLAADVLVYTNKTISGSLTSFRIPEGVLEPGTPYRWNMNALKGGAWGTYSSRLYFQVDAFATDVGQSGARPESAGLGRPSPNPFNAVVTIPFTVESAGPVELVVHNALGQRVATLLDGSLPAGMNTTTWDATGFASGTYIIRMTAGGRSWTTRISLVR